MKIIIYVIINIFLFHWGCYSQSRFTGRIIYHNSKEEPAQGVEVSAPGANSVFTTENGSFTLYFSHKKPGDRANIWIGRKDEKGKRIILVNKKSVAIMRIPSRPDDDPVELFVSSPEKLKERKQLYYNIFEKNSSGKYDKKLEDIEKQLKQNNLSAEVVNTLTAQIRELRRERDSAMLKIKELAAFTARINKDRAPGKVATAIENIEKGEYINIALATLDSLRLMEQQYKKNKRWENARYALYLGTNFSFTRHVPEGLYFEMEIELPDVLKSRWGLKTGIYENTTLRHLEDFILRPHNYEFIDEDMGENTYNLVQTGMVPNVSIQSLGFYLEFPYNLIASEHFNLSVAPHLEFIRRSERYSYEVSHKTVLTTMITTYSLGFSKPPELPEEVYSKYWESYLGISFPIRYRPPGNAFEINVNPIVGAGYPGPYASFITFYTGIQDQNFIQMIKDNSRPLFLVLFNATSALIPKKILVLK